VANAIRYTAPGAAIHLRAEQSADATIISVTNSGVGIDAQHLPRIFDRFYRVDQARSQSATSAGLGLAIVQSIMKLHGGRVDVESIPDGETTFRMIFPARPV
jgi:two-component system heavy metal sensor histidine kinase CusS